MKTILNKLAILAVATTFFLNVASAEIKAGPITINPGILFESTKINEWSGYSSNRNQPTYGVDLTLSHDVSGIYTYSAYKQERTDESIEAAAGSVDYEFCNTLGLAKKIDKVNLDLGYENCYYDGLKTTENTGIFFTRLGVNVDEKLLLGVAYAMDSTDGILSNDGTKLSEDAFKLYATYDYGFAKVTATYGETDNLTEYYKVGIAKDIASINFDLSFWDVSMDDQWTKDPDYDRQHLVLTAKKIF